MDKKLKYNKIELEARYNVIKDFTEKKWKNGKDTKEKYGVSLDYIEKYRSAEWFLLCTFLIITSFIMYFTIIALVWYIWKNIRD